MKTKCCSKCGEEKELSEFSKAKTGKYGLRGECKDCRSISSKNHYKKNKKRISKQRKEFRKNNPEYIKEQAHQNYLKNRKAKGKNYLEYKNNKYKTDLNYKIIDNLRSRVRAVLKNNTKSKLTLELLGCSIEELKKHLEYQFKPGMTWANHGVHGWHIDHITPCAKFDLSKKSEQLKCFNYRNLQPLWAEENWSKNRY